MKSVVWLCSDQ